MTVVLAILASTSLTFLPLILVRRLVTADELATLPPLPQGSLERSAS